MRIGNITFKTQDVDVNGTSLQGVFQCDYDTLCKVFGKPSEGDSYKTQANWYGKTKSGVVFTIYDWKEDQEPQYVKEWHIGGFDYRAVEAVNEIMEAYYEQV